MTTESITAIEDTEQSLSGMALDVHGVLTLVLDQLRDQTGDSALMVAVESAREKASCLIGAIDSIKSSPTAPEVVQALTDEELTRFLSRLPAAGRLSEEQRELIRDLAEDIAGGNVSPLQVATSDSARFALARLETETSKVSPGECAAELGRGGIHVSMHMVDDPDPYVVTERFTLKGLRWRVALQRLTDSITGNPHQEAWRRQS